jgi:ATP-dependent RNA helicase DDX49/DBP8
VVIAVSIRVADNKAETKLEEMIVSEDKALERLNTVSTAKRLAKMTLYDDKFGQREEIHAAKAWENGVYR